MPEGKRKATQAIHRWGRDAGIATVVIFALAFASQRGAAQALRGSPESVERMYGFAESHALTFYPTEQAIDAATAAGRLVPLAGGSYILGSGVGWPSVTAPTRDFVERFAPAYWRACGTPLVVTSAARPLDRQPRNANPHSVHPAGIAVDLRRPPRGPCLTWLRDTLTSLETAGGIEATEERHPAHFHVAVLAAPADSSGESAVAGAPGVSALPRTDADKLRARPRLHVRLAAFPVVSFNLYDEESAPSATPIPAATPATPISRRSTRAETRRSRGHVRRAAHRRS